MVLLRNLFPAFGIIMQLELSDSNIFEFSLYHPCYNNIISHVVAPYYTTWRSEEMTLDF
jgi:hypothetical protein